MLHTMEGDQRKRPRMDTEGDIPVEIKSEPLTPPQSQPQEREQLIISHELLFHDETIQTQLKDFISVMRPYPGAQRCSIRIQVLGEYLGKSHSCGSPLPMKEVLTFKWILLNRCQVLELQLMDSGTHESNCRIITFLGSIVKVMAMVPNLEQLTTRVPYFDQTFLDEKGNFLFPNLKRFHSPVEYGLRPRERTYGLKVLEGCPNLEEFGHALSSEDLGKALQHLQGETLGFCDLYGPNDLGQLEALAEENPKLRRLLLYGVGSRDTQFLLPSVLSFVNVLKSLVKSSCETLVELHTNLPILSAINQTCNSVLSNLSTLGLTYDLENFSILRTISFERMFPSLDRVWVTAPVDPVIAGAVPLLFNEHEGLELRPSATVKKLILSLDELEIPPPHLDLLGKAFPGATELHIKIKTDVTPLFNFLKKVMEWKGFSEGQIQSSFTFDSMELNVFRATVRSLPRLQLENVSVEHSHSDCRAEWT